MLTIGLGISEMRTIAKIQRPKEVVLSERLRAKIKAVKVGYNCFV